MIGFDSSSDGRNIAKESSHQVQRGWVMLSKFVTTSQASRGSGGRSDMSRVRGAEPACSFLWVKILLYPPEKSEQIRKVWGQAVGWCRPTPSRYQAGGVWSRGPSGAQQASSGPGRARVGSCLPRDFERASWAAQRHGFVILSRAGQRVRRAGRWWMGSFSSLGIREFAAAVNLSRGPGRCAAVMGYGRGALRVQTFGGVRRFSQQWPDMPS
jgi:hypothetical protein